MKSDLIIICGPTASGKSAYAISLAKEKNGAIINADSMQIYKEIPVLTASPTEEQKKEAPHYLYNYISLSENFSVTRYLEDAIDTINKVSKDGYLPIIVGGTGLYINALIKGINDIPDSDLEVRSEIEALLNKIGKENFHILLSKVDPKSSITIKPGDKQRMIRAYQIWKQTGKSIRDFQSNKMASPLENYNVSIIFISPDREELYKNCNERFIKLVEDGALEEVKSIYKTNSINTNALGFKELVSFCNNEISLEEAIILAQNKTRQYAKRQVTWFNNQLPYKSDVL